MDKQSHWQERLEAVECPAFSARRDRRRTLAGVDMTPIVYARGRGSEVLDVNDRSYTDLVAGFGSLIFGHGDPGLEAAVSAQRHELSLALGDVYATPSKIELCERLVSLFPEPGARVLLGSSGADALTAALKTAVLATGKSGLLAFEGGYHGLSHGPLSACGLSPAFRQPFAGQLIEPSRFAPYPFEPAALDRSLQAVRDALAPGDVGAVLVEPLLGRGGCTAPPPDFLPHLRALCTEYGALLVVDEVWTGLGRTGRLLASEGVVPDVLCLGKALGGGYPLSACVGRAEVMQPWGEHGGSFVHTATHFGAPAVTAAGNYVLDALTRDGADNAWLQRARAIGALAARFGFDAHGAMIGVELADSPAALRAMQALQARGVLVLTGGARGQRLTLSPAYSIELERLERALEHVREVCDGH